MRNEESTRRRVFKLYQEGRSSDFRTTKLARNCLSTKMRRNSFHSAYSLAFSREKSGETEKLERSYRWVLQLRQVRERARERANGRETEIRQLAQREAATILTLVCFHKVGRRSKKESEGAQSLPRKSLIIMSWCSSVKKKLV